jgi:Fe-Mn family superoxide dismutase
MGLKIYLPPRRPEMASQSPTAAAPQAETALRAFSLPPLPYGYQELEPHLSAQTLEIHYGKHHARYIEVLNRILADQHLVATSLEGIVRGAERNGAKALFNNAAQAWNHSFFWESMCRDSGQPGGSLADAIMSAFGSFEALGKRFIAEGTGHFGSGWVWLVAQGSALSVLSTHDAGIPVAGDVTPLLACDVWEHAYYLDYRQDRANWLAVWWDKLANWHFAERQYEAALGQRNPWRFPVPAA